MKKEESIVKQYIEFELLEGREPNSVFEFCKHFNLKEATFYKYFNSLKHIRRRILKDFAASTLEILDNDKNYVSFSANEKALALFFTLFETFLDNRSYLVSKYDKIKDLKGMVGDWDSFFTHFEERMDQIVNEAKQNQEIKDRPYISNYYGKSFKLVLLYNFRVWINDESEKFETTDAAIEKSINLAFEFLGKSPLDSLIDFGKFAIKTKVV